MSEDLIRYDLLVQDSLREVIRTVLSDVALHGLPGKHHFYLSFNTRSPGVILSERLRSKYPEDMTIILQHQFSRLAVYETYFEVCLTFSSIPEFITVPINALTAFYDPSVEFAVKFENLEAPLKDYGEEPVLEKPSSTELPVEGKFAEDDTALKADSVSQNNREVDNQDEPETLSSSTAQIVSLDAFRKKK